MANIDKILLNTDILVYAADKNSRYHTQAYAVREMAAQRKIYGCISLDILDEMFIAFTSKFHSSNPLSNHDALREYEKYVNLKTISKITPLQNTYRTVASLIKQYKLEGIGIRLAEQIATMLDNQVFTICTFKGDDYAKFEEIKVLNPFSFDDRQTTLTFGE